MESQPHDLIILFVGDVPQQAALLIALLQESGYHVQIALNGEHVVTQLVHYQHIDLVLLNVMLPGIDGFEVCRLLKQHEATWDIPVIFLTARDDLSDTLKAFEVGGIDCLTTPFFPKEILARIHTHIRLRKLQQQYLQQLERFRVLSQTTFEGILIVYQDAIIEMNEVGLQLFGYERQELLTRPLASVLPEVSQITLQPQEMPAPPTEIIGLKKDGSRFPLEIRIKVIPHHDDQAYILALRDLTWQKHAEQELHQYREGLELLVAQRTAELHQANQSLQQNILERQQVEHALQISQQQYRQLAEHIDEGIGIIQGEQFVFTNPALRLMLPKLSLRKAGPATYAEEYQTEFERYLQAYQTKTLRAAWQLTYRANGSPRYLEGRFSAITWNGGHAILLTMRDITVAKQKELALAAEQEQLEQENRALKVMMTQRERFGKLVGKSPAMQLVYETILKAAHTDVNVSIYGESGTGKELVARTIHQYSARQQYPFIPVNCSAIPEPLFESELFGYCKGAFTGAHKDKPGVFDLVQKGTLFLDEINSLPLVMQVKLLRVLEGEPYLPVGGHTFKQVEARIIVAGNEDFAQLVQEDRMRLDFFYRITVMMIALPPLREHKEDLPGLIQDILEQYRQNGQIPMLPPPVLDTLMHHHWPGNVRELQNVLHRYLTLGELHFMPLPAARTMTYQEKMPFTELNTNRIGLQHAVEQFERQFIQHVLAANAGHKGQTAAQLQVDPKTLYRKIKQYELV